LEVAFSQEDSFPPPRKFVCFLSLVKLLSFKKTDAFFYQLTLHLFDANPITVEILFFPVSRNQNLAGGGDNFSSPNIFACKNKKNAPFRESETWF